MSKKKQHYYHNSFFLISVAFSWIDSWWNSLAGACFYLASAASRGNVTAGRLYFWLPYKGLDYNVHIQKPDTDIE